MSDRKTALNEMPSNTEDEQVVDLDSVLEQHDEAASQSAAAPDETEQPSVLDAHEEPTKPGPVLPKDSQLAADSVEELPPVDDEVDDPRLASQADADQSGVPQVRARQSTGTYPPNVKSPFEDEEPVVSPSSAVRSASFAISPRPTQSPLPAPLPTSLPSPLPRSTGPALSRSSLSPLPGGVPSPVAAPVFEAQAMSAPRTQPGMITLRVSSLMAMIAGCFVSGVLVCLAISTLIARGQSSRPVANAPAATAGATAAQSTPTAVPTPIAAPLPSAPGPSAPAAAPSPATAPRSAAASSEPASARDTTGSSAAHRAATKGRVRRTAAGAEAAPSESAKAPAGSKADTGKASDAPAKGKSGDWSDPFVQ